jgi:hypothetical protein
VGYVFGQKLREHPVRLAEIPSGYATFPGKNGDEIGSSMGQIRDEMIQLVGLFNSFVFGLVIVVLERYLGGADAILKAGRHLVKARCAPMQVRTLRVRLQGLSMLSSVCGDVRHVFEP